MARTPGPAEAAYAAERALGVNEMDRDVDELLRQNAERQLADFDWDRQRQAVIKRLANTGIRGPRRTVAIRIVAGAAAVLVLIVGSVVMRPPDRPDRGATGTTVAREPVENDALLASTDPTTILLTGSMQLLVANDPTLAPHSLWDQ